MREIIQLPLEGVYDSTGNLFHHRVITTLKKIHYERLEEHGIYARSKARFTIEETLLIIKNWKRYADKHGIPVTDSFSYLPVDKGMNETELKRHKRDNFFWPELCRGLPHRTATQVRHRAVSVLEPSFLGTLDFDDENQMLEKIEKQFFTVVKLTDEMKKKIKKKLIAGKTIPEICKATGVRMNTIRKMRDISHKWKKSRSTDKFPELWSALIETGMDEEKFRELLIDENEEGLTELSESIKWKALSNVLVLKEKEARKCWKKFISSMLTIFKQSVEEGNNTDEAYQNIKRTFFGKPQLTFQQIMEAVEIICLIIQAGYDSDAPLFDKSEFARFMNNRLFRNLRFDFEWKVKYHVLLWAMKRMLVWSKVKATDEQSIPEIVLKNEKENPYMTKWTKKFLRNEQVKKWLQDENYSFMSQKDQVRVYGVEAFVLYCNRNLKEQFVFPTVMHGMIWSASVKEILCKEKNNYAYITAEDAIALIEKSVESNDFCKNIFSQRLILHEKIGEKSFYDWSEDKENNEEEDENRLGARLRKEKKLERELEEEKQKLKLEEQKSAQKNLETAEMRSKRLKKLRQLRQNEKRKAIRRANRLNREPRTANRPSRKSGTGGGYPSREFIPSSDDSDSDFELTQNQDSPDSDDDRRDSSEEEQDFKPKIDEVSEPSFSRWSPSTSTANNHDLVGNSQTSSNSPTPNSRITKGRKLKEPKKEPSTLSPKKLNNNEPSTSSPNLDNGNEKTKNDEAPRKNRKRVRKSIAKENGNTDEWEREFGSENGISPILKKKRKRVVFDGEDDE